jgi:hypothetical protein
MPDAGRNPKAVFLAGRLNTSKVVDDSKGRGMNGSEIQSGKVFSIPLPFIPLP